MPRKLGRSLLLLVPIVASLAACNTAEPPTLQPEEPRAITVRDTYYVRFHVDGVWYHAVSVAGDGFLPAQHRFVGPTYVRRAGEEVWQCHPTGYQIPQEAEVMMSGSRAPVTVTTMVGVCQQDIASAGEMPHGCTPATRPASVHPGQFPGSGEPAPRRLSPMAAR